MRASFWVQLTDLVTVEPSLRNGVRPYGGTKKKPSPRRGTAVISRDGNLPLGRVELLHVGLCDDVLGEVLAQGHLLAIEPVGRVLHREGAVAFGSLVGDAEELAVLHEVHALLGVAGSHDDDVGPP